MKIIFLQITFALCLVLPLLAQQDKCATDKIMEKRYLNDPVYAQSMDAWRNKIVQIAMAQQSQPGQQRAQLYTVPIVFHIILGSTALVNGITDNTILAQLNTLNKGFRKQNSDTTTIRSTFKPLASDIEIQFCIAARDPNGNSTTGITRTVTTHGAWDPDTEGDDMKHTASGGINAWNPTKYVNVWIVDIAGSVNGGVAGYAYVGGGGGVDGTAIDGIVLDFQIGFGANDRSLTHEMGHYFGLYHTWGNVDNSCTNDDGIADTPETLTANFGCNYNTNSCTSGSPDLPDQIENYMDYSSCSAMFTVQQKAVMRSVITGSRVSLTTSNGCQTVSSPPVADFSASVTATCPGTTITFTDASTNGATSWSWSFPGGTPSTSTQQSPTVLYSTAGTYNVVLTATNAFGSDAETKTSYITVGTGIQTTIFSEGFENGVGSWAAVNPDNGLTWEIVAGLAGSPPGDKAARVHLFNYSTIGQRDGLISPVIDLSGKTQISLTFNYAHRRYQQPTMKHDSLLVYVSTNGGASFTRLYANAEDDQAGASFATGSVVSNDFVPTSDADWCAASATGVACPVLNLNSYSGQANFRIKFETYNDFGNNIYIDNIELTGVCSGASGQAPTTNFTANTTSGCNAITVNFTDQSSNTPTSWNWQFTGGSPSTSTVQNPTVTYSTPGTYSVTLTSTNGVGSDAETKTNYITVGAPPTSSTVIVNASCAGVNNGSINLTPLTGTAPYTFHWSNNAISEDINNLGSGTYVVTVTDANGCSATKSANIAAGGGPSSSVVWANASCPGVNNGSVNLTPSGGAGPYTFHWSNSATSEDLDSLGSGTYAVTITDHSGCSTTKSATLSVGVGPSATASPFDAACSGVDNGFVDLTPTLGTPPYTYLWSTGDTTEDLTHVGPGIYTVTVMDANGCTAGQSGAVGKGTSLELSSTIHADSANTGAGSVLVTVQQGMPPYNYHWSTGTDSTAITGLNAGDYSLTITDANGCEAHGTYTVTNDSATAISVPALDLTYSIYPNPTDGLLNVQVHLQTSSEMKLKLYNAIGQVMLEQAYSNTVEINTLLDVHKLDEGVYFLRMENSTGFAVSRVVVMRN